MSNAISARRFFLATPSRGPRGNRGAKSCFSSKALLLLQAIIASYNNQIHSALPKPYTPSDVLNAIDDDPDDIIPAVLAFQKKQFGKKKGHYEVQWQQDMEKDYIYFLKKNRNYR
eukprot:COSAG01_NODE_6951_length_3415_cov_70.329723_2_plen_115_part_00